MADVYPELQELASRLLARPTSATPADKPPMMYGYVRTDEPRPAYADACADLLTWWSVAEGWRIGTIFRDLGVSSNSLVRAGFNGLLDVLRLPDVTGAVIVTPTHLSADGPMANRLRLAVRSTATSLHILADELAEVTP